MIAKANDRRVVIFAVAVMAFGCRACTVFVARRAGAGMVGPDWCGDNLRFSPARGAGGG